MNATQPIVRARRLTKKFDAHTAVDAVDFDIRPGEIVGFLGPNGAGKTTTIRMLLNILNPTSGDLEIFGRSFHRRRSEILRQMNASSGSLTLPGKLSVLENLKVFADMYEIRDANERIRRLLSRFDLDEFKNRSLYSLSTGQQVRVSLAKAFLNRPRLLLLDEPTASLDPDVADRVRSYLVNAVKEEGTTVFLTSHNMAEVEEVCTRVLFLNLGKIQAEGSPQELARRLRWRELILTVQDGSAELPAVLPEQEISIKKTGDGFHIEVDRDWVGPYLTELVKAGVRIKTISVNEPTLEDFFLHSARGSEPRRS